MPDTKRQLILDLLARNKMGNETNAAADDLDKLGRAAEDADKKTKDLGETTEKTGKQTDKLGHNLDDTKGRIAGLDREIENINRELGGLSASFADANSASERLDISKAIRRTEADLRKVTKNRSILAGLLPDPEPEARKWSQNLSKSLNDSLAGDLTSSSFLGTAVGVLGTTLAPEIGGLISAAIVGGVGLGGIIGGIAAAASSDQQIKDYAGRIGKSFVSTVQQAGRDAFGGPITDSLGKLEAFSDRTTANIGKIFRSVAPAVIPLVDNIIRAGDALEGSFVNAAAKSRPVLAALGKVVESTGDSLADLIDVAAEHSDEGASALEDFNDALQNTIKFVTETVDVLSTIKGGLDDFDDKIDHSRYAINDWINKIMGGNSALDLTADGYAEGSEAAQLYRDKVIGAAGSVNDYNHYLAGAVDSTHNLAGAQQSAADAATTQKDAEKALTDQLKAQTDPAFGLLSAIDDVHDAQKNAADSAHQYGAKSEEARSATRKLAEAAIGLQDAAGKAGGSLDGTMTPSLEATLHAAGLTKGQIANVAAELKRAKGAAEAYAKEYDATIKTFYISVTGTERLDQSGHRIGGYRANGGPIARGTPYVVGENGPEVVIPDTGGRVLSNAASRGLMASTGASRAAVMGGGGTARTVQLDITGGDVAMASLLKRLIRTANIIEG